MNLSEVIELEYLEAGADPQLARFVRKLIATYAKNSGELSVDLPTTLARLRLSSPLDDSQTLSEILKSLPSAASATDNFVLYRGLCRLVAIKLPERARDNLSRLANAVVTLTSLSESNNSESSELVIEALIGSLGSLHPGVAQNQAVKMFLNTPFLVEFPEALAELAVLSKETPRD